MLATDPASRQNDDVRSIVQREPSLKHSPGKSFAGEVRESEAHERLTFSHARD